MTTPISPAGARPLVPSFPSTPASVSGTPDTDPSAIADTAPVCQASVSGVSAPTALVNDFWIVVGENIDEFDPSTPGNPRPLRAELTAIGQAKGLTVRILSIEDFLALEDKDAPAFLSIGILGHGVASETGHVIEGKNRLYPTTLLMEHGRKLGAVAQAVWACEVGVEAATIAANPALMAKPDALYDLRGGKEPSFKPQSIVELRNMVSYYADCKEQNVCPANVEMYLQSQLRSANCLRLVSPPLPGVSEPGTIGHFPGPKGASLNDGVSIKDRLKPASADDPAIARFPFSAQIQLRTRNEMQDLLFQRVFRGDAASVRTLAEKPGIDINARSRSGLTPLHMAATYGNAKVVEILLKIRGMDIDARTGTGDTPLAIACQAGHLELARMLVQAKDADGNSMPPDGNSANKMGYRPLHLAALGGHADIVRELMQLPGMDVTARNRMGQTALLAACRNGHAAVVGELLKADEIAGDVEQYVLPAMMEACTRSHIDVMLAILNAPGLASHKPYLASKLNEFALRADDDNKFRQLWIKLGFIHQTARWAEPGAAET